MALSLSRNAKFYVGASGATTVQEIGILDGFSFSQATGTQNVTLNEAGASPKRGQQIFNTSVEPVDWSFTSYVRPNGDSAVEKLLWNALVSNTAGLGVIEGDDSVSDSIAPKTMQVSFASSDSNQLLELDGYFVFKNDTAATTDDQVFHLAKMCVNSASIDFDIDGIAQIAWTGYASSITATSGGLLALTPTTLVAVPTAADFILNRLSTVTIGSASQSVSSALLALTGGNITIDNGITYVTPETLGTVNKPFTHQTGTRAVSGNLTCYLDGQGKTVYDAVLADITGVAPDVTNNYELTISIGGAAAPKVSFSIADAHLELPSIDTADVMGVTINFTGLESSFGSTADETLITYSGT
jgi:hypothetical protein